MRRMAIAVGALLAAAHVALAAGPAIVAGQAAPVTFNEQIAPIVFANCSSCHRPGGSAPFPLLTYADVRSGRH